MYRFQVYLGKENNNPERNLAQRVVRDLTTTVAGSNHHLYMDNFYCDPHPFLECKDSGIYCCGTVRPGRKGFPKDTVISKADEKLLQRGHYQWRAHGQLIAMSWFNRCGVYLLSTIHPPKNADDTLPTVPRSNGRGERIDFPCPPAQVDYQLYMGGVDLSDQLIKTSSAIRKSRKTWKKLFGYGLEICLLDSFIIMKTANSQSTKEFITYRLEVARQLIGQRSFRQKAGRPPSLTLSETEEKRLNDKKHSLEVSDSRRDLCCVCQESQCSTAWQKLSLQISHCLCHMQLHSSLHNKRQILLGEVAPNTCLLGVNKTIHMSKAFFLLLNFFLSETTLLQFRFVSEVSFLIFSKGR